MPMARAAAWTPRPTMIVGVHMNYRPTGTHLTKGGVVYIFHVYKAPTLHLFGN
jgi:hypothetical protein